MAQAQNAVGKPREWWGLVHVVQGPAMYRHREANGGYRL